MDELFDAKAAIIGILSVLSGALVTLLGFITKRLHDRVDAEHTRVGDHLEDHDKNYVLRAHLDKTIADMNSDRRDKHQENVATLARIESKIDQNEKRASDTRHEIRDKVGTLTTQVAVLETLIKKQ